MKNVMVDLETLDTVPGAVILSIGAVFFDETGLGTEFYKVVHRRSCEDLGMTVSADTLAWWSRQSIEASQVLRDAELDGENTITSVLNEFNDFLKQEKGIKVWGNGADFDNPLLAVAYRRAGVKQGWLPYNGRCYRTLKNVAANVPGVARQGTYHNALHDAKTQAQHVIDIYQANPGLVWK